MLLDKQDGVIYGPVNSRRLGKSLGINLSPGEDKLCSFNCIYCHYGWTGRHTLDYSKFEDELPGVDQVVQAVKEAMQSKTKFDYVTFSGNGEPTLHPAFPEIVEKVIELRDNYRPKAKIALLTNSSGVMKSPRIQSVNTR